jgi:hypothetical protein
MRQAEINARVAARADRFWQAVIVEGRTAAAVGRDEGINRTRVRQIIMHKAERMGIAREHWNLAALRRHQKGTE